MKMDAMISAAIRRLAQAVTEAPELGSEPIGDSLTGAVKRLAVAQENHLMGLNAIAQALRQVAMAIETHATRTG